MKDDGAYIEYVPTGGADTVQKKLGEPTGVKFHIATMVLTVGSTSSGTVNIPEYIYTRSDFNPSKFGAYGGGGFYNGTDNKGYIDAQVGNYDVATHKLSVSVVSSNNVGTIGSARLKDCYFCVYYDAT